MKINLLKGHHNSHNYEFDNLTTIKIYGAKNYSNTIYACIFTTNLQPKRLDYKYDS